MDAFFVTHVPSPAAAREPSPNLVRRRFAADDSPLMTRRVVMSARTARRSVTCPAATSGDFRPMPRRVLGTFGIPIPDQRRSGNADRHTTYVAPIPQLHQLNAIARPTDFALRRDAAQITRGPTARAATPSRESLADMGGFLMAIA